MGKSHIRHDKTCLNCFYVVENRFCGNCGQENIETRKTFHHLFVHFFEDLTHYENSFWKTIRNLLFKPASLSREYLLGKRMSYLAPVRLYIFISFITFFLMAILRSNHDAIVTMKEDTTEYTDYGVVEGDTIAEKPQGAIQWETKRKKKDDIQVVRNDSLGSVNIKSIFGFNSVAEFDSIQKYGTEDEKVPVFLRGYMRKSIVNAQQYTGKELAEKINYSIMHNFPKMLLIYMPIFAFFLWLFHNKNRWYYFDHGIFTLHYFSFLLLITLILFLKSKVVTLFGDNNLVDIVDMLTNAAGLIWMFYYFFPAHYRFYGGSLGISLLKSFALLIVNIIIMILLFVLLFVYSFINIH